jgi:predicted RNA-binding protein with PUA-like domain
MAQPILECKHVPAQDEPGDYSIDDLEREGTAEWDGVRNYQARNIMQRMKVGNQVCVAVSTRACVWLCTR